MADIHNDQTQTDVQQSKLVFFWVKIRTALGLETKLARLLFFSSFIIIFFSAAIAFYTMPPSLFAQPATFTVKDGTSLGEVSLSLFENHLIRSRVVFEFCAITLGGEKRIMAGDYLFKEPIGTCTLAWRIVGGVFGIPAVRVTIPEGFSNREAAAILSKALPRFDAAVFIKSAEREEGYLFPDTYFFSVNATSADVLSRIKINFDKKIKTFSADIVASKHSEREILTMASLLEKEVPTDEDRAIVSGILWKRIAKSIPLQVDAPFMYILGKKSSELTQADLRVKSAYNTYRNRGLPGGPINNPGASAIRAALFPKESPYLYYLADKKGVTHYAKTFEEHKANKEKYLH